MPYIPGSVVWFRHQPPPQHPTTWAAACWPGVITRAEDTPHGWEYRVQVCGSDRWRSVGAAWVAEEPCDECLNLWTRWQWQQLGRVA
jgi:hypothetical protein